MLVSLGMAGVVWGAGMLTGIVQSGIWLPVAGFLAIWPFAALLVKIEKEHETERKQKASANAADRQVFRQRVEGFCQRFRMVHGDEMGTLFREWKNDLPDHTNVLRAELIERGYDDVPSRCEGTWESFGEWYSYLQGLREKLQADGIGLRPKAKVPTTTGIPVAPPVAPATGGIDGWSQPDITWEEVRRLIETIDIILYNINEKQMPYVALQYLQAKLADKDIYFQIPSKTTVVNLAQFYDSLQLVRAFLEDRDLRNIKKVVENETPRQ